MTEETLLVDGPEEAFDDARHVATEPLRKPPQQVQVERVPIEIDDGTRIRQVYRTARECLRRACASRTGSAATASATPRLEAGAGRCHPHSQAAPSADNGPETRPVAISWGRVEPTGRWCQEPPVTSGRQSLGTAKQNGPGGTVRFESAGRRGEIQFQATLSAKVQPPCTRFARPRPDRFTNRDRSATNVPPHVRGAEPTHG